MKNIMIVITSLILFAGSAAADTTWVEGPMFGSWSGHGDAYFVRGNITVPLGRTLNIEPGALVKFFGHYSISVLGELVAQGTEEESIRFTTDTVAFPDRWKGIRILAGSATLCHCLIEHCAITQIGEQVASGIHCASGAELDLTLCTVQHCRSRPAVGCFTGSHVVLKDCILRNNNTNFGCCGGGLGVRGNSRAEVYDCLIQNNFALDGGGVYVNDGSDLEMIGTTLADNSAHTWGGGLYVGGNGRVVVKECFLLDNEAGGSGGGLQARGEDLTVVRCNFVGNESIMGAQVHCDDGAASFTSTIFSPINGPHGIGAALHVQPNTEIRYCNIRSSFIDEDFSGDLPSGLGGISRTNANGDSCDAFFNIYLEPLMVDPFFDDFYLQQASPCIDAGDPELPLDPDSTWSEIGALFFDQTTSAEPGGVMLPDEFVLGPAYPNPFNPSTTLTFELARDAVVSLRILDLLSREVAHVASGFYPAGSYAPVWNATDQPSGIYFAELTAGDFRQTRKLVLIK